MAAQDTDAVMYLPLSTVWMWRYNFDLTIPNRVSHGTVAAQPEEFDICKTTQHLEYLAVVGCRRRVNASSVVTSRHVQLASCLFGFETEAVVKYR